MSATTKKGRSRNRRALSLAAAPGGWPPQMFPLEVTYDAAGRFWLKCSDPQATDYVVPIIDETLKLAMWDVTNSVMRLCAVAPGRDSQEVLVTIPVTPGVGHDFIVQPWQSALRGFNAEWLACSRIIPRG
jgi:hypothetical protein